MILRKDEGGDDFSLLVSKLVENEGEKRRPFVKSPLLPHRRSFFDWLRSVFRFKRDPFKASPFAAEIGLRERTEKSCEEARGREETASLEQETIVAVNVRLKDYSKEAFDAADEVADRLDAELRDQENILNQCRPENLKSSLLTYFEERIGGLRLALAPFARDCASAAVSLQEFYEKNSLDRGTYWGKELSTGSIAAIGGIVVFEFVLNTIFFAGSNPLGLVGSASVAFLLSIGTIFLGVFAGVAFQLSHKNYSGRIVGIVLMVVSGLASIYYLLLLTSARLAGENGELRIFSAAAEMIQSRPFAGLLDLPSLAYCFFSIAVILGVAIEFVMIMGRFPGLRRLYLNARYAEEDFEDEQADLITDSQEKGKKCIEALDHLPAFINGCRSTIGDILIDYANVRDQFVGDIGALKSAETILFGYVKGRLNGSGLTNDALSDWGAAEATSNFERRLDDAQALGQTLLARDGIRPEEIDSCREDVLTATNAQAERIAAVANKILSEAVEARKSGHLLGTAA